MQLLHNFTTKGFLIRNLHILIYQFLLLFFCSKRCVTKRNNFQPEQRDYIMNSLIILMNQISEVIHINMIITLSKSDFPKLGTLDIKELIKEIKSIEKT